MAAWLKHDSFLYLGKLPVALIKPRDILTVVKKVEARGAVASADLIAAQEPRKANDRAGS